jgi:hypothetical protein
VRGTHGGVWLLTCSLVACASADATGGTLAPLPAGDAPAVETSAPLARDLPHQAWYREHRRDVEEQLTAIRTLLAELAAAPDSFVLQMICRKGVPMDEQRFVSAETADDAHPEWVRLVGLTRWMTVSCEGDATRAVTELSPQLDAAVSRFERWLAGLAPTSPGSTPTRGTGG